jgi:hypothetical protein
LLLLERAFGKNLWKVGRAGLSRNFVNSFGKGQQIMPKVQWPIESVSEVNSELINREIEENLALFKKLLGKKSTWKIPIEIKAKKDPEWTKFVLNSHIKQLNKVLTSSDSEKRQKVYDLFNEKQSIRVKELADWIKKNRVRSQRLNKNKPEEEKFLGKKYQPSDILNDEKWQKELKLSAVEKDWWGPKIYSWAKNREMFVREHFRRLMRLLYSRDLEIHQKVKKLFKKEKINFDDIHEFYSLQPKLPALKVSTNLSIRKAKKLQRINQLFTFKINLEKGCYYLFDGQKQLSFANSHIFFNHCLKIANEEKNLVLFGFDVLNLGTLQKLIQEALNRGYFPTIAAKNKGTEIKKKLTRCYLKGDQIIVKDWITFTDYQQKNKLEQKEEFKKFNQDRHNLRNLYHQIKRIETKTQNKYQFSLLDKAVTSTVRVAWKDFWQTFEKEREKFGWENIWSCNKQEDEFIRQAYRGGYLDLFNEQNYSGLVSDWDFKGAYPTVMYENSFPISRPEWIDHPKIFYGDNWKETFYGYYQCQVDCLKINPFPFLQKKDEESDQWVYRPKKFPTVLFSEEIKFFWKYIPKIKIEVQDGYFFRSIQPIFSNWIRKNYRAKEKGDEMAKLRMNSCYGMFGREKEHLKLEWSWTKKGATSLEEFLIPQKGAKKKKLYLILSEEPRPSWRFTNVAIAATITAYQRIKLQKACLANWDNLLYCNTDAFVIKGNKNKFASVPAFENSFCGKIEKEGEYHEFISLAPNSYAFKNKKGVLAKKGATLKNLTDEQVNYLLSQPITEENKEKILKFAPNQNNENWMEKLKEIVEEISKRKKKQLVNGKWEIYTLE